jgi:pilus assembly protein CpaB
MRIVFAIVLFFGISIAGGAVYLAMDRFSQYESALADQKKPTKEIVELTEVYVAAGELQYGQPLTREDVRVVKWPVDGVPDTAFTDIEDLIGKEGERDVRTVLRLIDPGEVILASKITGIGEDAGVSSRLAKGMRAFAIRVDVASGVSGFLRPGDKIDVYWSGDDNGEFVTQLILDGITLIAIDQMAQQDRNRPTVARTVTVSVSPQVVASLVQAQTTGKLLLSLRGVNDDTTSEQIEVTQRDLLGRRQEEQIVEEKVCSIKTRKGAEVIDIPIPCANTN